MRLALPLALAAALLQEAPHPLDRGLEAITESQLRSDLFYLASDALEGRCAGFPGNDRATEFIASRFCAAGLKAFGDPDEKGRPTYFQHFTFRRDELRTRNCVGLLEGSDPTLKEEVVVIGAHHDHVGKLGQHRAGQIGKPAGDDDIWNGADDNGSGTTALLAVVTAFGASDARPKRSILFMTFSAEEWGLIGSRYYAEHPLVPLEKTVAMLNMDMVGRTDEPGAAGAYGLATVAGDVFRPILERASRRTGLQLSLDPNFGNGSDHLSFFNKGLPILGLSERGPCPDYHRVTDHPDRIEFATMAKIARTAAMAVFDIADLPETPRRDPAYKRPSPPDSVKPRLGIYLQAVEGEALRKVELRDGEGALEVAGVEKGSVAEAAGIREKDILVGFAGRPFAAADPRASLVEQLGLVVRGEPYPLEIVREGKRMTLKCVWSQTENDRKIQALIAKLPKESDVEIEKQIADFGEEAEARARRLEPAIARRVLSGIKIRVWAENAHKSWGTRWFFVRDREGRPKEWTRISIRRSKDKGEPLEIEFEGGTKGAPKRSLVTCARDSRLSLIKVLDVAEGRREAVPKERISASGWMMASMWFIAGTRPERYEAEVSEFDAERGRAAVRKGLLEDAGESELQLPGGSVKCQKFTFALDGSPSQVLWVSESGVFARVEYLETKETLDLSSEEEVRRAFPK